MRPAAFLLLSSFLLGAAVFPGCRLVDEDMSDCGDDFTLDYELQLVTNMRTEIQTVLDLQADIQVATSLREYLGGVFSDFAHDVDLSFYDTVEPMARLEHMQEVMDATQTSYTLYIPVRNYMHTCVANLTNEPNISLEDAEQCHTARLVQHTESKDTVNAHTTGIFTARRHMDILTGVDQHFDVDLYMVNAATALVLNLADAPDVRDIKVCLTGFADGFNLADSTYTFDNAQIVRTTLLPVTAGSSEHCYASVHFPSRDVESGTKTIIETDEPFISDSADEVLWQWQVYATLADGTVTRSVLGSFKPLRAAQLKVVKARVHANGAATTDDSTVGVSVTLDWGSAGQHDIDL